MSEPASFESPAYSLQRMILYFLHLGATGFGGPIVLSEHMQDELVVNRQWVSKEEYAEGLALAQLAPGPLAAQLAIYLGWVRSGVWGATLVGIAFILPSFSIVLVLAEIYRRYQSLPWIQASFYGVGAAIIAIMAQSAAKLLRRTIGKDRFLLTLAAVNAAITIIAQKEILWVFVFSGALATAVKMRPRWKGRLTFAFIPAWLMTGLYGEAEIGELSKLILFFAKAGSVVFGSGLAIVPFLHGGVVQDFRWLNERQFLDAVAVAMITPGPVVITVGFIGYLVAGFLGSLAAAIGVFLPVYLFVVVLAPYFNRVAKNQMMKSFVDGVTTAAIGSIAGAAFILGRRAISDFPTALIFLASLLVVFGIRKIPEPILILVAGIVGLVFKG